MPHAVRAAFQNCGERKLGVTEIQILAIENQQEHPKSPKGCGQETPSICYNILFVTQFSHDQNTWI